MSVHMKTSRGKTGKRRSHHKLETAQTSACAQCGAPHVRHRACENCGTYRGKQVINIEKKTAKAARRKEAKEKAKGE